MILITDRNYNGKISIEAPNNVMDKIVTKVFEGILYVKIKESVILEKFIYKSFFSHKELRSYSISGASSVNVLLTQKIEKKLLIYLEQVI